MPDATKNNSTTATSMRKEVADRAGKSNVFCIKKDLKRQKAKLSRAQKSKEQSPVQSKEPKEKQGSQGAREKKETS